jgi:hypothetical protein
VCRLCVSSSALCMRVVSLEGVSEGVGEGVRIAGTHTFVFTVRLLRPRPAALISRLPRPHVAPTTRWIHASSCRRWRYG